MNHLPAGEDVRKKNGIKIKKRSISYPLQIIYSKKASCNSLSKERQKIEEFWKKSESVKREFRPAGIEPEKALC